MSAGQDQPWGSEANLTLVDSDRYYHFLTCDSNYLTADGGLSPRTAKHTCFSLEFNFGKVAFRDVRGRYLGCGSSGTLKCRSGRLSKIDLFTLHRSNPLVFMLLGDEDSLSVKQREPRTLSILVLRKSATSNV